MIPNSIHAFQNPVRRRPSVRRSIENNRAKLHTDDASAETHPQAGGDHTEAKQQADDGSTSQSTSSTHKRYVDSLDGLRSICALGVVFYHMNLTWCEGGLLGVTVLFVLSGYLAMGGLLKEFQQTRRISCGHYYLKRIKRLLPTAIAYVVITLALCTIFNHQLLTKMRPDIIPGLLMFINRSKIITQQSYFAAAGAPSPMTHFWSLAIEFQFYLAWPPILYLCLRHRVKKKNLIRGLAVATLASALIMALLYVPEADPSRAYYGTDARAQSLLLGCLLALVFPFNSWSNTRAQDLPIKRRIGTELSASLGTIALVVLMVTTNGYSAFSYWGGTLLVSVIAAVAIAGLIPQGTIMARILSVKPLTWIGKRSFGIYIWHYIIVELLTPRASVNQPWYLIVFELALTFAAAELSYRLIEEPFRRNSIGAVFKRAFVKGGNEIERSFEKANTRGFERVHSRSFEKNGSSEQSERIRLHDSQTSMPQRIALAARRSSVRFPTTIVTSVVVLIAIIGLVAIPPEAPVGEGSDKQQVVSAAALKKPLTDGVYDVIVIGDSVALGASDQLNAAFPHGMVDCAVGRQAGDALAVYQGYADQGAVGNTVIFSIGTNGALDQEGLQQIYDAVGPDKSIWFINDRAPRSWCAANNQLLSDFAANHENVGVIDWYGDSEGHNDWFWDDGIHLRPEATQQFADLVVSTTGYEVPTEENTNYQVIFLGDSVSINAADSLSQAWPYGLIDCAAGRDPEAVRQVWQNYVDAGTTGRRVVIALPSDVPLSQDRVDLLLDTIGSDVEVWLVNANESSSFTVANNQMLSDAAAVRSNVHVIDWNEASAGHPEYLTDDGKSLTDAGVQVYSKLIVDSVGNIESDNASS